MADRTATANSSVSVEEEIDQEDVDDVSGNYYYSKYIRAKIYKYFQCCKTKVITDSGQSQTTLAIE